MENQKNTSRSLSRRGFLQTSALAGGGMLIGFNVFAACNQNTAPPVDLSQLNYNDFNAFIKISNEGKVTIFSPNPEISHVIRDLYFLLKVALSKPILLITPGPKF